MQLNQVPLVAKFRDVEGIPVAELASGEMLAFEPGHGLACESRPYPSKAKALREGDILSRREFIHWIVSGRSKFDVVS